MTRIASMGGLCPYVARRVWGKDFEGEATGPAQSVDKPLSTRFCPADVDIYATAERHEPKRSLFSANSARESSATQFQELFDPKVLAVEGISEFLPQFRLLLDDISHQSDDELMRRALDRAEPIVPVVLWALRDARNGPRLIAAFKVWAKTIEQIWHTPHGRDAVRDVFSYISKVTKAITVEEIIQVVEQAAPATQEVIMTLAEQWLQQGRAEGEAKGRVETARQLLTKLLRLKFPTAPESALSPLTTATEQQLDTWAERVLTAVTLDEVFAE